MTIEAPAKRVIGWACERHGLGWVTREEAEEHVRRESCRWGHDATHAMSLAELQAQMDDALHELHNQETAVSYARSKIGEASAHHRKVRLVRDAAKERADAARRLWAAQAQAAAKSILNEKP